MIEHSEKISFIYKVHRLYLQYHDIPQTPDKKTLCRPDCQDETEPEPRTTVASASRIPNGSFLYRILNQQPEIYFKHCQVECQTLHEFHRFAASNNNGTQFKNLAIVNFGCKRQAERMKRSHLIKP
ncbi:hypothetical protein M9H77_33722 [Catharanthus roseus]|uniref:Uncharacterized protein n=1 Tax=Catharanthus roseus TaxID=4058 RepID=A0ACB9ZND9_CATRO|nr:hypothetical protein M9H77_33722 [Catharanthus roseus]